MSLTRREFLGLSGVLLSGASLGLIKSKPPNGSINKNVLNIAYPTDIAGWEPSQATPLQSSILKCVFDQPLELDKNLNLTPSIVTDYQWLDRHGQRLKLHFRNNIRFQNGDLFTALDFKFSFFDRVKLLPNTLLAGIWGAIDKIELPDLYTAVVHFQYPMVNAISMLADIPAYILPHQYYLKVGEKQFRRKPIGSGPFQLVEYQPEQRIVLEANPVYWQSKPYFSQLNILIVKDHISRAVMLESGQVDLSLNFSSYTANKLGEAPALDAKFQPTTGIMLLQLVNQGILKDKSVRLALHHAINKPLLSQALYQGHANPIYTPAGVSMPAYDENFSLLYNPAYAKQLLRASGINFDKQQPLNIYTTKGILPNDLELVKAIAQMWNNIGIKTKINVMTQTMITAYQNGHKFDGPVLYGWNPATGDPSTYSGFLMNPNITFSLWQSDDIKTHISPALAALDMPSRIQEFKKFDRWQVSQGYSIPLFQNFSAIVSRNSLNIPETANGILDMKMIKRV